MRLEHNTADLEVEGRAQVVDVSGEVVILKIDEHRLECTVTDWSQHLGHDALPEVGASVALTVLRINFLIEEYQARRAPEVTVDVSPMVLDDDPGEVVRRQYFDLRDSVCVNPDTFVSSSKTTTVRHEPPDHRVLEPDMLSGRVSVEWEALTPLLCAAVSDSDGDKSVGTFATNGHRSVIPGSSLKGAVRSLHESLTASCWCSVSCFATYCVVTPGSA